MPPSLIGWRFLLVIEFGGNRTRVRYGRGTKAGFRRALLGAAVVRAPCRARGGFFGEAEKGFPPRTSDTKAKPQHPRPSQHKNTRNAAPVLVFTNLHAGVALLERPKSGEF